MGYMSAYYAHAAQQLALVIGGIVINILVLQYYYNHTDGFKIVEMSHEKKD